MKKLSFMRSMYGTHFAKNKTINSGQKYKVLMMMIQSNNYNDDGKAG